MSTSYSYELQNQFDFKVHFYLFDMKRYSRFEVIKYEIYSLFEALFGNSLSMLHVQT